MTPIYYEKTTPRVASLTQHTTFTLTMVNLAQILVFLSFDAVDIKAEFMIILWIHAIACLNRLLLNLQWVILTRDIHCKPDVRHDCPCLCLQC